MRSSATRLGLVQLRLPQSLGQHCLPPLLQVVKQLLLSHNCCCDLDEGARQVLPYCKQREQNKQGVTIQSQSDQMEMTYASQLQCTAPLSSTSGGSHEGGWASR